MSTLMHLIYSSAASRPFDRDELLEMLERARSVNATLDVTGMLLYVNGSFLQILEGPPIQVEELFEKIALDKRHTNIVTIISEPIARRDFEDWSMGFAEVTEEDLKSIDGLEDFFGTDYLLTSLDPGRTKKLLKAFREGRWRSQVGGLRPAKSGGSATTTRKGAGPP